MAYTSSGIIIEGHRIGFDRRRCGSRTYTWAHIEDPSGIGAEQCDGDPWPCITPPRGSLEQVVRQTMDNREARIANGLVGLSSFYLGLSIYNTAV